MSANLSRWRKLWRCALAVSAAIFFVMWIASHWTYTSIGLDDEILEPGGTLLSRYMRVRWPGDGSLWFGHGHWRDPAKPSKALERFDLAATFFQPPRRPPANSHWNRIGFWRERVEDADGRRGESWLGLPGWLPVLMFGWLAAWQRLGSAVRRRRA